MRSVFKSTMVAGALSLTATFPALADVTAQELRDEIVGFYEGVGYEVTIGSETESGGTLTLKDVSVVFTMPEDVGEMIIGMGDIVLRENGDGSVEVEPANNIVFNLDITPEGEDEVAIKGNIDLRNMLLQASGSLEALKLATTANGGSVRISSVEVDGEAVPINGVIDFGAIASNYTIVKKANDRRRFSGDSSLASVELSVGANDPKGDGLLTIAASMSDLVSIFSVEAKKTEDIEDFLASGFSGDVALTYGASDIEVNFQDGDDRFAMTGDSAGGKFAFSLSPEQIGYEIGQTGASMNISSSELPIPSVNFSYDEFSVAFGVPLAQSDDPSDFHVRSALRGLEVSEAIWAMIDPGQALPRDPATIAIDIAGTVLVLADLMDPETLDSIDDMDGPPMLPVTVDLNDLTVAIAGALLNGSGSVEFDFESPAMIAGVPIPFGSFEITLDGAYGLLDKLVALGLVPEDASMGVRAMLGAFARPVGDDQFESKIELTEDGGITANGLKLQ